MLPSSLEKLLTSVQDSFNEALRNEKQDVPEHKPHPPFHFDYVDSDVPNAFAFACESYSFIGITIGLVELLWDACDRLSRSEPLMSILGLQATEYEPIHVVLFRTQLSFVVGHEFTHHVHGHLSESTFSDELRGGDESGNLEQQMVEVDEDGYSAYHVLNHLMEAEGREHAVELLKLGTKTEDIQDRVLFSCFVAAIAAYLFARPPVSLDEASIYELTHPPQAARMNCLMQQAIGWSKQNRPHLATWTTLDRFQKLMETVAEATWGKNGGRDWAEQTAFLGSEHGSEYFKKVDKSFKAHVQAL